MVRSGLVFWLLLAASLAVFGVGAPRAGAQIQATLRLDPLPGDTGTRVTAVNDANVACGHSDARGAAWIGGAPSPLPGLGGPGSFVRTINSKGWVGGSAQRPNNEFHAFVWVPRQPNSGIGRIIDLGLKFPGATSSDVIALNDSLAVGQANGQPALWDITNPANAVGRPLPVPAGFGSPRAVSGLNPLGQITGFAGINGWRADPNGRGGWSFTNLGKPPGTDLFRPTAIGGDGSVLGIAFQQVGGTVVQRSWLKPLSGAFKLLPNLGGRQTALLARNRTRSAGFAEVPNTGFRAIGYDDGSTTLRLLEAPGFNHLFEAVSVNRNGNIAANGFLKDGEDVGPMQGVLLISDTPALPAIKLTKKIVSEAGEEVSRVSPGDRIRFIIEAENVGDEPVPDFEVEDVVELDDVKVLRVRTNPDVKVRRTLDDDFTVVAPFGDLAPGAKVRLVIVVRVKPLPEGEDLRETSNTATGRSGETEASVEVPYEIARVRRTPGREPAREDQRQAPAGRALGQDDAALPPDGQRKARSDHFPDAGTGGQRPAIGGRLPGSERRTRGEAFGPSPLGSC